MAAGISVISTRTGIEFGRVDQGILTGSPAMVLILAILSFIVIAPAEEYLFRGVIQQRLSRSMQTSAAIVITSFLFVIPHAIGYLGGVSGILLLSIVPFSLAVVMGVLYEKHNNLSLPILAHGFYNATLFVVTYITTFYSLVGW
jgi:membrane protease YdiL (CAAX protease family)